jgi:hypothetical protein
MFLNKNVSDIDQGRRGDHPRATRGPANRRVTSRDLLDATSEPRSGVIERHLRA